MEVTLYLPHLLQWLSVSLVPRPPPFLCERGRPGNTYHVNDIRWMQGGCRGVVLDYKYVRNKPESKFLTGQAEGLVIL